MAITWEFTVRMIDLENNRVQVLGVRTDDADPQNPVEHRFGIDTLVDPAQPAVTLNTIEALFEDQETARDSKATAIATKLGNLESALKTRLETWEGTR